MAKNLFLFISFVCFSQTAAIGQDRKVPTQINSGW